MPWKTLFVAASAACCMNCGPSLAAGDMQTDIACFAAAAIVLSQSPDDWIRGAAPSIAMFYLGRLDHEGADLREVQTRTETIAAQPMSPEREKEADACGRAVTAQMKTLALHGRPDYGKLLNNQRREVAPSH